MKYNKVVALVTTLEIIQFICIVSMFVKLVVLS